MTMILLGHSVSTWIPSADHIRYKQSSARKMKTMAVRFEQLLATSFAAGAREGCSRTAANLRNCRSYAVMSRLQGCRLVGCGSALPKVVIRNEDLSQIVETSDDWISTRTGIHERRVLSDEETLTRLSTEASRKALEMAQLKPDDVDLILMCTSTPEDIFGSGPQVSKGLGCKKNVLATDIRAACSGFLLGLLTGAAYIKALGFQNVLVIGADALSRYVDWTDRGTCILFGDAAAAVLLQACDIQDDALLGYDVHSDGGGQRYLMATIKDREKNHNSDKATVFPPETASLSYIQMNGKEVFRFAVRAVPLSIEAALVNAGLASSDLDWLLLHQANQRIMDAVAARLQISSQNVLSNLANYGNTSAASIPLALDEAVQSGKVKAGDVIAVAGFGAGLTWGSAIIKWH